MAAIHFDLRVGQAKKEESTAVDAALVAAGRLTQEEAEVIVLYCIGNSKRTWNRTPVRSLLTPLSEVESTPGLVQGCSGPLGTKLRLARTDGLSQQCRGLECQPLRMAVTFSAIGLVVSTSTL